MDQPCDLCLQADLLQSIAASSVAFVVAILQDLKMREAEARSIR